MHLHGVINTTRRKLCTQLLPMTAIFRLFFFFSGSGNLMNISQSCDSAEILEA